MKYFRSFCQELCSIIFCVSPFLCDLAIRSCSLFYEVCWPQATGLHTSVLQPEAPVLARLRVDESFPSALQKSIQSDILVQVNIQTSKSAAFARKPREICLLPTVKFELLISHSYPSQDSYYFQSAFSLKIQKDSCSGLNTVVTQEVFSICTFCTSFHKRLTCIYKNNVGIANQGHMYQDALMQFFFLLINCLWLIISKFFINL